MTGIRLLALALALAACTPSFDDLRHGAWSQSHGAPDGVSSTDYAHSISSVDREQPGATVVVAGADPPSLTTLSFDVHGDLTQSGTDLSDLSFASAPTVVGSLDPVVGGDGLFAVAGAAAPALILLFDARTGAEGPVLRATIGDDVCGGPVAPVSAMVFGLTLLGAAEEPDLVALAGQELIAFPDIDPRTATPTCLRCTLTDAQARAAAGLDLALANLDGIDALDELLVSIADVGGGPSRLVDVDLTALQPAAGAPCLPAPPEIEVIGNQGEADFGADIATGDADMSAGVEIALTAPSTDRVYVLLDVTLAGALAPAAVIPAPAGSIDFAASAVFGDFDANGVEELAIGNLAASPETTPSAGQVTIYSVREEGGFEPDATLYDSTPTPSQSFGRALSSAEFIASSTSTDLLLVAAADEVFTYFQTVVDGRDPRQ